jgi:sigma-B regulation protein RsbU (phosphoserine phosphatase)
MPDQQNNKSFLANLIESLMPTTRMGYLMLAGLIVWFINWTFSSDRALFGSETVKAIFDLGSVLAFIPLIYFLFKGLGWVVRHLLWRLRRRLIVTYFLIGVLPLALLLCLVALIGYGVIIQSSSNLVAQQLDGFLEQSGAAARAITRELGSEETIRNSPAQLRRRLQARADALASIFPGLTLTVRQAGQPAIEVSADSTSAEAQARAPSSGTATRQSLTTVLPLPKWLDDRAEFHGLVFEEGDGARRLYARHIIKAMEPAPLILLLSYPLSEELAAHLSHTTGLVVQPGQALLRVHRDANGELVFEPNAELQGELSSDGEGKIRVRRNGASSGVEEALRGYPIFMPIIKWETGEQWESDALYINASILHPDQIWKRIRQFKSESVIGEVMFYIIATLGGFFLVITLGAIISATFLTRSITGAVHHLYQGTRRIEAGDLEHEIPTHGRDQLGSLAVSFNQMTRSVRELLRVSAEKERLDQEMRIAAEVQARLFPRAVPASAALDLAPGICIPARAVSGDYYDFIEIEPGVTGLVVADVCGKGMSAALLMANLQANLRSQVQAYRDAYHHSLGALAGAEAADAGSPPLTTSAHLPSHQHPVQRLVQRVNQQLAASILDASYVTLFYAEFDERASALRYTNAGHNPPLWLSWDGDGRPLIKRLDCGGMVLGLFSDASYEEAAIELASGDVVMAFTDGLVEARNPRGEEFDEPRLVSLLIQSAHLPAAEIERLILQAVKNWTAGADQEDDLTLIILKKQ